MTYMRFQIVIVNFTNLSFHVQNFHLTSQVLLWCGQAKPQKSPAKNWWHYPPSPPWEARAPGLALGNPHHLPWLVRYLSSCLLRHRATQTHHGTCFETSCHWTLCVSIWIHQCPGTQTFCQTSKSLDWISLENMLSAFQVGIFQASGHFPAGTLVEPFNCAPHAWRNIMRKKPQKSFHKIDFD